MAATKRPLLAASPKKPTPTELDAARDGTIADVLAHDLTVLFCGINPSLYSAAVGHHFARPGNRFWPALHLAGYTERVMSPFEDTSLAARGYGLTNLVARATARADELGADELEAGGERLRAVLRAYRPRALAVLGISAFREAFARPKASAGEQPGRFDGVRVWALPNPSGLNAHYRLADIARAYEEVRIAVR